MFEVAYCQHRGLVCVQQQDALWTGRELLQSKDSAVQAYRISEDMFVAVADGVAISPLPHFASKYVVGELAQELKENPAGLNAKMIRNVHGKLCDKYAKGKTKGTATTLAALQILNQKVRIANVGDSRIYKITPEGQMIQLSKDHTFLQSMKDADELFEDDLSGICDGLDSCLVADHQEDTFDVFYRESNIDKSVYILTTDGVHDVIDSENIKKSFVENIDLKDAVYDVFNKIIKSKAPDNFSIVVVQLVG